MTDLDIKKHKEYWLRNSKTKWEAAEVLYQGKKYVEALFFCHLTLECLLKGLVVEKISNEAPYIHNLIRLAELTELDLTKRQKDLLKVVSTFNLRTRYEDYKFQFYKKATKSYTEKYLKESDNIRLWLSKKLTNDKQKNS